MNNSANGKPFLSLCKPKRFLEALLEIYEDNKDILYCTEELKNLLFPPPVNFKFSINRLQHANFFLQIAENEPEKPPEVTQNNDVAVVSVPTALQRNTSRSSFMIPKAKEGDTVKPKRNPLFSQHRLSSATDLRYFKSDPTPNSNSQNYSLPVNSMISKETAPDFSVPKSSAEIINNLPSYPAPSPPDSKVVQLEKPALVSDNITKKRNSGSEAQEQIQNSRQFFSKLPEPKPSKPEPKSPTKAATPTEFPKELECDNFWDDLTNAIESANSISTRSKSISLNPGSDVIPTFPDSNVREPAKIEPTVAAVATPIPTPAPQPVLSQVKSPSPSPSPSGLGQTPTTPKLATELNLPTTPRIPDDKLQMLKDKVRKLEADIQEQKMRRLSRVIPQEKPSS